MITNAVALLSSPHVSLKLARNQRARQVRGQCNRFAPEQSPENAVHRNQPARWIDHQSSHGSTYTCAQPSRAESKTIRIVSFIKSSYHPSRNAECRRHCGIRAVPAACRCPVFASIRRGCKYQDTCCFPQVGMPGH